MKDKKKLLKLKKVSDFKTYKLEDEDMIRVSDLIAVGSIKLD